MGWWTDLFTSKDKDETHRRWAIDNDYLKNKVSPELHDLYIHWTNNAHDWTSASQSTAALVVTTTAGLAFGVGFWAGSRRAALPLPWRRFTAVSDIPSSYFGGSAAAAAAGDTSTTTTRAVPWLRGRVLSVSDGDTIRFRHAPLSRIFSASTLQANEKVSDVALPIRICTIDTPETAKFGQPGQPYGNDAKEFLRSLVDQQLVRVRLLQKDQYGRAVAEVRAGIWPFYRYVDEKMIQAGLAEVYKGSGAVYGRKGLPAYLAMEEEARRQKKGMWKQANRESASEFKARLKEEGGK